MFICGLRHSDQTCFKFDLQKPELVSMPDMIQGRNENAVIYYESKVWTFGGFSHNIGHSLDSAE
jgi:hypothetical protein